MSAELAYGTVPVSNKMPICTYTIRRYLTRRIGFEAVMRLRCTEGVYDHMMYVYDHMIVVSIMCNMT